MRLTREKTANNDESSANFKTPRVKNLKSGTKRMSTPRKTEKSLERNKFQNYEGRGGEYFVRFVLLPLTITTAGLFAQVKFQETSLLRALFIYFCNLFPHYKL